MEIINILLATIVAFLFSALYYSPKVFGEAWMNSLGYTDPEVKQKKTKDTNTSFVAMLLQNFIITFLQLTIVAFFIQAFQVTNFSSVLVIVLLLWVMMTSGEYVKNIFSQRRFFAYLIPTVDDLVRLIIGASIIYFL